MIWSIALLALTWLIVIPLVLVLIAFLACFNDSGEDLTPFYAECAKGMAILGVLPLVGLVFGVIACVRERAGRNVAVPGVVCSLACLASLIAPAGILCSI
jgi:uncharacterized Tic20 family protein